MTTSSRILLFWTSVFGRRGNRSKWMRIIFLNDRILHSEGKSWGNSSHGGPTRWITCGLLRCHTRNVKCYLRPFVRFRRLYIVKVIQSMKLSKPSVKLFFKMRPKTRLQKHSISFLGYVSMPDQCPVVWTLHTSPPNSFVCFPLTNQKTTLIVVSHYLLRIVLISRRLSPSADVGFLHSWSQNFSFASSSSVRDLFLKEC